LKKKIEVVEIYNKMENDELAIKAKIS